MEVRVQGGKVELGAPCGGSGAHLKPRGKQVVHDCITLFLFVNLHSDKHSRLGEALRDITRFIYANEERLALEVQREGQGNTPQRVGMLPDRLQAIVHCPELHQSQSRPHNHIYERAIFTKGSSLETGGQQASGQERHNLI
jgi:hypothetical protein